MTVDAKAHIEQLMVDVDSELLKVLSMEDPNLPNLTLYKIKKSLKKQKEDLLELKAAYE